MRYNYMDLGAFLQPGCIYSVLINEPGPESRVVWGALREHRGRPFWTSAEPLFVGRLLSVEVKLQCYGLDDEGALHRAGPESTAMIVLAGQVKGCRFFQALEAHVLRMKLLGRILADA